MIGPYLDPPEKSLALCCDEKTQCQAKVKAWLAQHPAFHMHCTPISSSWMSLVERFFADITQECVQAVREFPKHAAVDAGHHGIHGGAQRAAAAVPLGANGAEILAKIQRAREALAGAAICIWGTRH